MFSRMDDMTGHFNYNKDNTAMTFRRLRRKQVPANTLFSDETKAKEALF